MLYVRSGTTHGAALLSNEEQVFEFSLAGGFASGSTMKATLVWMDVEATVNSRQALVNDLDLIVEIQDSSGKYLGRTSSFIIESE